MGIYTLSCFEHRTLGTQSDLAQDGDIAIPPTHFHEFPKKGADRRRAAPEHCRIHIRVTAVVDITDQTGFRPCGDFQ
jgi:hypothetical protein